MKEIKVGDYVRTKSGIVGKVIGRHGGYGLHYELDVAKEIQENLMNGIVHEDNIVKHSKNIIDLIEVKDIVKVHNLCGDNITFDFEIYDVKTKIDLLLGLEDKELELLEILTHEQFEQNSYKV